MKYIHNAFFNYNSYATYIVWWLVLLTRTQLCSGLKFQPLCIVPVSGNVGCPLGSSAISSATPQPQ